MIIKLWPERPVFGYISMSRQIRKPVTSDGKELKEEDVSIGADKYIS